MNEWKDSSIRMRGKGDQQYKLDLSHYKQSNPTQVGSHVEKSLYKWHMQSSNMNTSNKQGSNALINFPSSFSSNYDELIFYIYIFSLDSVY